MKARSIIAALLLTGAVHTPAAYYRWPQYPGDCVNAYTQFRCIAVGDTISTVWSYGCDYWDPFYQDWFEGSAYGYWRATNVADAQTAIDAGWPQYGTGDPYYWTYADDFYVNGFIISQLYLPDPNDCSSDFILTEDIPSGEYPAWPNPTCYIYEGNQFCY